MLRHKALIQAGRIAFGFSGIADEDDADLAKPITGRVVNILPADEPAAKELAAPQQEATPAQTTAAPKSRKAAAPAVTPKATPLEGLRNLMTASGITEAALLEIIAPVRNEGVTCSKIDFLTAEEIENTVKHWDAVVAAHLKGQQQEAA